jgi:hypothetical protein
MISLPRKRDLSSSSDDEYVPSEEPSYDIENTSPNVDVYLPDLSFSPGVPKKRPTARLPRADNSLCLLTRNFVELVKTSPQQQIDLNDAVTILGV